MNHSERWTRTAARGCGVAGAAEDIAAASEGAVEDVETRSGGAGEGAARVDAGLVVDGPGLGLGLASLLAALLTLALTLTLASDRYQSATLPPSSFSSFSTTFSPSMTSTPNPSDTVLPSSSYAFSARTNTGGPLRPPCPEGLICHSRTARHDSRPTRGAGIVDGPTCNGPAYSSSSCHSRDEGAGPRERITTAGARKPRPRRRGASSMPVCCVALKDETMSEETR